VSGPQTRTARIAVYPTVATISPVLRPLVGRPVAVEAIFEADRHPGCRNERAINFFSVGTVDGLDQMIIRPGLVPRAVGELQRLGYDVQVTGDVGRPLLLRCPDSALAGPVLYDTRPSPQTHVHMATPPAWHAVDADDELDRKRKNIWQHADRNGYIARLANDLAGGRDEDLYTYGLLLDTTADAVVLDPDHITVLVESSEHAEALGSLMTGWTVRQRGDDPTDDGRIATRQHLRHHPVTRGTVLRADAGEDGLEALVKPGIDHAVNVVDPGDETDAKGFARCRARIRAYRRDGWTVCGPDAITQPDTYAWERRLLMN